METMFQPTIATYDMSVIYHEVYRLAEKGHPVPEILICRELESAAVRYCVMDEKKRKTEILILKEDDDSILVGRIMEEIQSPSAPCKVKSPVYCHTLGGEIPLYYEACRQIAGLLKIPTPQIIFSSALNETCVSFSSQEDNNIILPSYDSTHALSLVVSLAHEMRHLYQNQNPGLHREEDYYCPENLKNVSDDEYVQYASQPSEIDAEAFARAFVSEAFGINAFRGVDPSIRPLLRKRAKQIQIEISERDKVFFRNLWIR